MQICAAMLAANALAQTPEPLLPPDVYRSGNGVSGPRVIEKTDPEYSEEARLAQLWGTIPLRVIVDAAGLIREVKVTKPIGLGLDEKAIDAVSKWRFEPGMKDGQAVAVIVAVEVNFRYLDTKSDWHLERAVFQTPEGASRPTLARFDYPADSPAAGDGSVSMSFEVGPDGIPMNLHVQNSTNAAMEKIIIGTLHDWRFHPALKDNAPVAVPSEFEFVHRAR